MSSMLVVPRCWIASLCTTETGLTLWSCVCAMREPVTTTSVSGAAAVSAVAGCDWTCACAPRLAVPIATTAAMAQARPATRAIVLIRFIEFSCLHGSRPCERQCTRGFCPEAARGVVLKDMERRAVSFVR